MSWLPALSLGAPVSGYRVFRMDEPKPIGQWTLIGETGAEEREFTDTAIPPGVVAFYYVVANSAAGQGLPSQPTASGGDSHCPWFEFDYMRFPPQSPVFHPECIGAISVHLEVG